MEKKRTREELAELTRVIVGSRNQIREQANHLLTEAIKLCGTKEDDGCYHLRYGDLGEESVYLRGMNEISYDSESCETIILMEEVDNIYLTEDDALVVVTDANSYSIFELCIDDILELIDVFDDVLWEEGGED